MCLHGVNIAAFHSQLLYRAEAVCMVPFCTIILDWHFNE